MQYSESKYLYVYALLFLEQDQKWGWFVENSNEEVSTQKHIEKENRKCNEITQKKKSAEIWLEKDKIA